MSNASLKEQLQALSLGSHESKERSSARQTSHKNTRLKKPIRSPKNSFNQKPQKPVWLEHAQYGVELLKAHFPLCFKDIKEIQPLKKGIKQDLVKELSTKEEIVTADKACMVSSLSYYVNSIAYHKSVIVSATRIGLDGAPSGLVTAEEAQYSTECRKTKLLKKKPQSASQQAPQVEATQS